MKKIKDIIVGFGIALFRKKTIPKKIIYPLILIFMLTPSLYFIEGIQVDSIGWQNREGQLRSENQESIRGRADAGENTPGQQAFVSKRDADVWYKTGCNMREPERIVKRNSITYVGLYIDTAVIFFSQKETEEYFFDKKIRRLPEPGRSNWSLRAPPVVC